MRKSQLLVFVVLFLCQPAGLNAYNKANLYDYYSGKKSVKVCIQEVENSSGETNLNASILENELKNQLLSRKSVKFSVAPDRQNSEISIKAVIKKYKWSENDPIDMVFGAAAIALDAATQDNYAYIETDFFIYNTKTQKQIWHRSIKASATKSKMPRQESLPILYEKLAKSFITYSTSKKYSKHYK